MVSTTTPMLGGPFAPTTPTKQVWAAHILPATDAPTLAATASTGGTLAAGTYYYKVAALLAAATPGYGPDAAETAASDEQVVTVGAAGAVSLTITPSSASGAPTPAGYRIYRTIAANGVSQTEVFLEDNTGTTLTDDGSITPTAVNAHPLIAGMLSEWQPGPQLAVARAYPAVTTVVASTTPYLYVVGGASSATVLEKTWEVAALPNTGASAGPATAFAPALTGSNDCTTEPCMSAGRWSPFAVGVTGPTSVTNASWLLVGGGVDPAVTGGEIIEHMKIDSTTGLNVTATTWATVGAQNANFNFKISPNTYGPIGFYINAAIAIVDGWSGGLVKNQDEFVGLRCVPDTTNPANCAAGGDFELGATGTLTTATQSGLGLTNPTLAWSGYTITSGYIYIVGGTTDGTNAVSTVQQGAQ
jgi:hypothetical protein